MCEVDTRHAAQYDRARIVPAMARLTQLSRSLSGVPALVTGAASGMGRATAHLLADEGAKVAVVDVTAHGVDAVVGEINDAGGVALGWVLDVSDGPSVVRVVGEVADQLGGLQVLINNAGIALPAPISTDGFDEAWERTLAVNLTAQVRVVRAALPHLLASGAGRIVNIASTEGIGAQRWAAPYTASKHGVVGLTRSLAVELGRSGVTANCVCPGPIRTGMTAAIPDDAKAAFAKRKVPVGRYGDPEEVAHVTVSLCLPAMSFLNGAVIPVDGGMTIQND
jgi:3-oxoacyl-[acyl-carrier protein] reductase